MRRKYCMKIKHRIMIAAALTAVLILCFGKNAALALFDQNQAVQLDLSVIENSTLLIGTHLIYLHSLNDQIYEIALQSASDSGQDRMYYKSELAGGMWMDITDAESISDISAGGTVADANEINSLYLTHHTKSDGITYDLRTQLPVCIFDITSVYELETLPELEALKLQYDLIRESGSRTYADRHNIELISVFFATDVHTDEMRQYDLQLAALQSYYNELAANDANSKYLETALDVMEKVSNARKAQVFTIVGEALSTLQDSVADAGEDDAEINATLLSAIGDSQFALEESLMQAQGNLLSAQDGVVSEKEYSLCMNMISNAEGGNFYGCDEQNLLLQYLGNINNGRIVDRGEELALLEELTESADARYERELSAGTTAAYEMLVSQNVSHAARKNRMKEDAAGANAARAELEFLIQGVVDRRESIPDMAGQGTQDYILQRIQDAAKFKSAIKQDDYAGQYQDSVSEYVQWLSSLLASVKQAGGSQGEEESLYEQKEELQQQKLAALDSLDLDAAKRIDAQIAAVDEQIGALEQARSEKLEEESLYEQKEELRQQKLAALDSLDLDAAKRIDAQIAAVDEQIGALEQARSEKLEELLAKKTELERQLMQNSQDTDLQAEISRLEAELAAGESDVSGSSRAANITKSKNEILEILAEGDTGNSAMERLADHVDLLSSMLEGGSPLAMEAMKEVYTKLLAKSELEGVNTYDSIQSEIETAIAESAVRGGTAGGLSTENAENIIADALGVGGLLNPDGSISPESLKEAATEDVLAALLALGDLNSEPGTDSSMEAFTRGFAAASEQKADLPVFQTMKKLGETYVPVEELAYCLNCRYVWNDTRKTAVLSKGREFYSFTAYGREVITEKDESLSMDKAAEFSEQLFIPGSFVQKQFGYSVCEISGTDCSVLVNDKVIERSKEILSELLEKGGY